MGNRFIYGFHAINLRLQTQPASIQKIFVTQNRHDKRLQSLIDKARQSNIPTHTATIDELDQWVSQASHQGVVALIDENDRPMTLDEVLATINESPLLLVLDGVTDPHNLGACLRVADAMQAHAVIAPKDRSAKINATVSKVACGAAETVPYILVTNLARTLDSIKKAGIPVWGLAMQGERSLFATIIEGPVAWVLGSEGSGMRRLTQQSCDMLVSIPMRGLVESLNVSVCAGIVLSETRRQRASD